MNVGFTFDLKAQYIAEGFSPLEAAEFDSEETVGAVEAALTRLGHTVDRIGNFTSLVRRAAESGVSGQGGRDARLPWDIVFNIAEGWRGAARESQVPALLEAYGTPCVFADSLTLALCLHKGYCKDVVKNRGIPTAKFAVVSDADDPALSALELRYPLFAKPVAEGTGKGVTPRGKATTPAELRAVCADLIAKFRQPVIVEEFLPGREFTVGIVGTGAEARVLGVMEVLLLANAEAEIYTFENKDKYEDRVRYRLAEDGEESRAAAEIALASYRALGCRDAGRADVRSDAAGRPQFMEINPLAGLNPKHSDLPILCRLLGVEYEQLIGWIMESAAKRVGMNMSTSI